MRTRRAALAAVMLVVAGMAGAGYSADDRKITPLEESYRMQAEGDWVGAQAAMREAADAAPRSYFARLRLAYLQLLSVDYAAAADSYRAAANLEPGAVEPLLGQQQALIALERWDAAERAGKDLTAKDPKSYVGLSRLAWTYRGKGDFRTATDLYLKLLALYPGDAEMRVGLGYALLGQGKRVEALAAFREVLAMVPGHADAEAGREACK